MAKRKNIKKNTRNNWLVRAYRAVRRRVYVAGRWIVTSARWVGATVMRGVRRVVAEIGHGVGYVAASATRALQAAQGLVGAAALLARRAGTGVARVARRAWRAVGGVWREVLRPYLAWVAVGSAAIAAAAFGATPLLAAGLATLAGMGVFAVQHGAAWLNSDAPLARRLRRFAATAARVLGTAVAVFAEVMGILAVITTPVFALAFVVELTLRYAMASSSDGGADVREMVTMSEIEAPSEVEVEAEIEAAPEPRIVARPRAVRAPRPRARTRRTEAAYLQEALDAEALAAEVEGTEPLAPAPVTEKNLVERVAAKVARDAKAATERDAAVAALFDALPALEREKVETVAAALGLPLDRGYLRAKGTEELWGTSWDEAPAVEETSAACVVCASTAGPVRVDGNCPACWAALEAEEIEQRALYGVGPDAASVEVTLIDTGLAAKRAASVAQGEAVHWVLWGQWVDARGEMSPREWIAFVKGEEAGRVVYDRKRSAWRPLIGGRMIAPGAQRDARTAQAIVVDRIEQLVNGEAAATTPAAAGLVATAGVR